MRRLCATLENEPEILVQRDQQTVPVDEPFGTAPLSHEAVIELPYALTPAISRTVVELLTVGGVLKQTFAFAPTGPQTITNAQITAALGAETDFVLRAWFESAGRRSIESDQITVRKV